MTELRNQINNIVEDYNACKVLAKSIENPSVYEGTTATAEDIREGKTAYSNGERIIGTMTASNNNVLIDINATTSTVFTAIGNTTKINLTNVDLSRFASIANAFASYSALEEIINLKTTKVTNFSSAFNNCNNLKTITNFDTSKGTNFNSTFRNCTSLEETPLIDMSKVTNCANMFSGCTKLKTINLTFDEYLSSSFYTISDLVKNCPNLTDESLNIIMLLASKSSVTGSTNKTLYYLGISQDQATRCQSLSNYQAFINAGWTTGY